MIADAIHRVGDIVDGMTAPDHGPMCSESATWESPDNPDARVVPVRVSDEMRGLMMGPEGWKIQTQAVFMRELPDGTYSMYWEGADEIDHAADRQVQRMLFSALDMVQIIDSSNCDLPDRAVDAIAEFKRAAKGNRKSRRGPA